MIVAVHAIRQEDGTFQARLVLTRDREEADPDIEGVLQAVGHAVWSLGYPTKADTHTVLAWAIPRQAIRLVTREMVRVSIQTVAQWREEEIPLPTTVDVPFSAAV